jgi:hypothetical protein
MVAAGSSRSSSAIANRPATSGVVRRWEDVVSDDDEGEDRGAGQALDLEKTNVKASHTKRARHSPPRRARNSELQGDLIGVIAMGFPNGCPTLFSGLFRL